MIIINFNYRILICERKDYKAVKIIIDKKNDELKLVAIANMLIKIAF